MMSLIRLGRKHNLIDRIKCFLLGHKWVGEMYFKYGYRYRSSCLNRKGGKKRNQYYEKRVYRTKCLRCGKIKKYDK